MTAVLSASTGACLAQARRFLPYQMSNVRLSLQTKIEAAEESRVDIFLIGTRKPDRACMQLHSGCRHHAAERS